MIAWCSIAKRSFARLFTVGYAIGQSSMNSTGGGATRRKRLLVAIPCLNEATSISNVVSHVPRAIQGVECVDILIVDDGSTDETSAKAKQAGAMVLRHAVNRGVGMAFQSAVAFAVEHDYDIMLNIDGDGQFDPADIPKLVAPIEEGTADMVTASRFLDPELIPKMPPVKRIGNHMMSFLISSLVRAKYADVSCGFRCYSREALLRLNLHGAFTYTQETFLDFAVSNMRILEVPIAVKYFQNRKSRVVRGIWGYALNTATIIFRGYRDYFPLRFFIGLSLLFAIPGTILGLIFIGHFILTGKFSPYLFAGFGSGFFFVMATLFLIVGVVADMLDRIRANQERVLYLLKKGGQSRYRPHDRD